MMSMPGACRKTIEGVDNMKSRHQLRILPAALCAAGLLMMGSSATVYAKSGEFTFVTGTVQLLKGGQGIPRPVTQGTEVDAGDIIITGPNGMVQLTMVDEVRLSLRSNSRLVVERYPDTRAGAGATLNLVRGTLRAFTAALTGLSKENFRMRTRVATVGIRGSGNIMNQSDDDSTTINYTIEGSHEVRDADGKFAPIITNPNQTVQVVFGQAPKLIPTPPSLLDAGKTMVGGGQQSAGVSGTEPPPPPPPNTGGTQNGSPVVGGNGLGYTLVDATANLTSDPVNLQNIAIAANGTAFSEQAVPGQISLESGALRGYTAYAGTQSGTSLDIKGGTAADLQTITIGGSTTVVLGRFTNVTSMTFAGGSGAVGAGGVHFGYAGAGFPAYLSDVLTGSVTYRQVGATSPTSNLGIVGQLVSSVLDVNFTARTLNATLGISMPAGAGGTGGSWTMQATNVPFSFNSFVAFSGGGGLVVTNSAGQNSTANGRLTGAIEGSFVGATLNGALIGYGLTDQTSTSPNNYQSISGVVAFQGASQNAASEFRDGIVSDPNNALNAASYIRSFGTTNRPDEVTVGANGAVSAFTAPYVNGNQLAGHRNYAQGTASVADNGFDATTGLVWGRWAGGTANVGGVSTNLSNASLHYIFGPTQNGPVSLPLTGTATYDVVGSTRPTDTQGHIGTLNSATLNANFTQRTVDTSINVGINGQTWTGTAQAVPIYRDQYFSAYGGSSVPGIPRPSVFAITCAPNCTPTTPSGSIDGFFTGRSGRGAGVMYNMNNISGAVAFSRRGG